MLPEKLLQEISAYIQRNYIYANRLFSAVTDRDTACQAEAPSAPKCEGPVRQKLRKQSPSRLEKECCVAATVADITPPPCGTVCATESLPTSAKGRKSLEEYIKLDKKFAYKLGDLIREKGLSSVECYKKAHVSKQTWYKIETDPNYKPNKKTVLSFAVALELNLEQTQELLRSVGFTLSNSSLFDVILMYCIENRIHQIPEIDDILFHYDQETLFSRA